MRLINLIGLFFLLFSFVVTGRDLSVRQSGKELLQHPRLLFSKQEEQRIVIYLEPNLYWIAYTSA